jgi:hypothetical protein
LFAVAIIVLIIGIALLGSSFQVATQSKEIEQQIGSQTGASIVKFTLPSNYSNSVTFYANGSYKIDSPMMLRIVNQTGAIEYYEQAVDFPIQAHLFNISGEYVATFEGLETTNSTALTVTTKETVNQKVYPYFYLAYCSVPITWLSSYLIFLSDDNPKNKRFLKPILFFSIAAIAIFGITFGISASFPDYVKVQAAIDVLKALAEVDGVMLGLSSVMFAQLFSSIMGFQNVIFERRLTRKKNPDYEPCRKEIAERKRALVLAAIGAIGFFLASIIASLINLATVESYDPLKDTYAPFGLILLPIFFLVEAIAILVVALAGVPMEPPIIDNLNEKKE